MDGALWVELSGEIIIARLRGEPTVELLAECQARSSSSRARPDAPRCSTTCSRCIRRTSTCHCRSGCSTKTWATVRLRRAIVVPTAKLAYLARLAFGEGDYRVFYNDIAAALKWLTAEPVAAQLTRIK